MTVLDYLDLGRRPYGATLEIQQRLWTQVAQSPHERAAVVLVEHDPPVITLGRRAQGEHVLADPEQLSKLGVEIHSSTRGGDVTFHGPGQLVAYPIVRVTSYGGIREFLRALERAVIRVLGHYGIAGRQVEGLTGVWAGEEKISAIGVAVRRWVSYHGLSLNVGPDVSGFDLIVPCGLHGKRVTSISRVLGRDVEVSQVKPLMVESLVAELGFDGARALPE